MTSASAPDLLGVGPGVVEMKSGYFGTGRYRRRGGFRVMTARTRFISRHSPLPSQSSVNPTTRQ